MASKLAVISSFLLCFYIAPIRAQLLSKLNLCEPADICNRIVCPEPPQGCKGEIEANAGVCGCCPECVTFINKNENCGDIRLPLKGKPSKKCSHGLQCDFITGKCVDKTGSIPICVQVKAERKKVMDEIVAARKFTKHSELWEPACDSQGFFVPKQCKGKKCVCVDPYGTRIFGQAEIERSENMTCACSISVHAKMSREDWGIKSSEHCTSTGDYEDLQCVDDTCYCVDTTTGKPTGPMVRLSLIRLLPCFKVKEDSVLMTYLTACEEQAIRERNVSYEFAKKGVTIDIQTIRCDLDGSFSPRQCTKNKCECTDREGVPWMSYALDLTGGVETRMFCNCARDEMDNKIKHTRYPNWKCDQVGNFAGDQCIGKKCFCVDEDGDPITEMTLNFEGLSSLCTDMQKKLNLENMVNEIKTNLKKSLDGVLG